MQINTIKHNQMEDLILIKQARVMGSKARVRAARATGSKARVRAARATGSKARVRAARATGSKARVRAARATGSKARVRAARATGSKARVNLVNNNLNHLYPYLVIILILYHQAIHLNLQTNLLIKLRMVFPTSN